jgi:Domain of unknown function (DUF4386)
MALAHRFHPAAGTAEPRAKLTQTATGTRGRRLARIAGLLYLIVAIFGGFAEGVMEPRMYVAGDAAATAGNVAANASLVRAGVVADLFQATVFLFVGMALYLLLSDVNRNLAAAMVVLVAIATAIMCLNDVFEFAALRVATSVGYAAAFGAAGSSAIVLLLLDIQHYGLLIAQIFFGLWLLPLGYLAYGSGRFPKALGVLLVAGGACYLVDTLARFLAPDFAQLIGPIVIVSAIAELSMVGYLLAKGVRSPVVR